MAVAVEGTAGCGEMRYRVKPQALRKRDAESGKPNLWSVKETASGCVERKEGNALGSLNWQGSCVRKLGMGNNVAYGCLVRKGDCLGVLEK
eukprot:4583740-Pleurochrysis_carterae.AAC.1